MSLKFGRIDSSETNFTEQNFHKNQTITSASVGVQHIIAKEDEYSDLLLKKLTVSGSHWATIHTMFYSSGSTKISQSNPDEINKFNSIYHNFNQHHDLKPFHTNKFYSTASIFYIPQQYFGERIKPGSFQLTARTGSATTTAKQIIIKDDYNGNLYSTNASHSQSAATNSGSSDNYVGNLYYDLGMAILTETGSWSGSVNYTDIGPEGSPRDTTEKNYKFWELRFNTTTPIFTSQYSVKINAGDFNRAMNYTTRLPVSSSLPSGSNFANYINMRNELTASSWSPYFNQIHLYRSPHEEPLIHANLPRSIKMRDDIDLIITFRVDH